MVLTKIALLIFALSSLSAAAYTGKRKLDRDYYAINIPSQESAVYIANKLGVRYEGIVGELDNWHMLSTPNTLEKRQEHDRVLSDFEYFKSQSIYKRDEDQHHWLQVKQLDKQVLKKRTRRAPVPPVVNATRLLQDTQKELHIKDPLFPKQWHLVRSIAIKSEKDFNHILD